MEKTILVFYVNTTWMGGSLSIKKNLDEIREVLIKEDNGCLNYIVATKEESRIECINPRIVSEDEYKEVLEKMEQNQKAIDEFLVHKQECLDLFPPGFTGGTTPFKVESKIEEKRTLWERIKDIFEL